MRPPGWSDITAGARHPSPCQGSRHPALMLTTTASGSLNTHFEVTPKSFFSGAAAREQLGRQEGMVGESRNAGCVVRQARLTSKTFPGEYR